jgi:hypothetical protein
VEQDNEMKGDNRMIDKKDAVFDKSEIAKYRKNRARLEALLHGPEKKQHKPGKQQ